MRIPILAVAACAALSSNAFSAEISVPMFKVTDAGIGESLGKIIIAETAKGVALQVDVTGLAAGQHGFHLHENGSCEPAAKDGKPQAAIAAGPHYDPGHLGSHKGPAGTGHKGDLPALVATDKGVKAVVNADHLTLGDMRGRSLMIHQAGDNYTDTPENGGGGARVACGVIPEK